MVNYVLSCCSTVDLSKEHLEHLDISYICFHYSLNGVSYKDDLWQSVSAEEFYKAMAAGADTNTSQVNVSEFEEYFTEFASQGRDILHVSLSSGLSGSYNSACIAARNVSEKFPDVKIYIVDSLAASSGYGLLMDKLGELRAAGMSIDELRDWAEENKLCVHHWFFSTDLSFYVKGGRISKTSGAVGTLLGICPLLDMDEGGHLTVRSKVRSKKRVINEIVERMKRYAQDRAAYSEKCFISQSACLPDAQRVAELVESAFPNLSGKVLINSIGTTIGSHTGPGTVALFFWGDKREGDEF